MLNILAIFGANVILCVGSKVESIKSPSFPVLPTGLLVFKLICKCNYIVFWPNTWLSKWNLITYITMLAQKNYPIFHIIHTMKDKERKTGAIQITVWQCKTSIFNDRYANKVAWQKWSPNDYSTLFLLNTHL